MLRRNKELVLRPVFPNLGIQAMYRRRLRCLIDEMNNSILYWIQATYRATPPVMAMDDSAASQLRIAINKLTRQWQRRFDDAADELAAYFATAAHRRSDATLRAILKKGGFSVQFKMTAAMRDILKATITEQVGLIKSIPQQYLVNVQGAVMRSVQRGGDLGTLTKELEKQYGVTRRRAALIARDQNNKANSSMTRARQLELGIDTAVWLHSHGGREPRKTHLANSGKRYDPAKGWFDPDPKVNRYIFPGELINCFPGDMKVGLETHPIRLWRAPFDGPMVHISVGPDLLKGTPNHPILTARGWIGLGELDGGDYVVCMRRDNRKMVDNDKHHAESTFKELFEARAISGMQHRRGRESCNFYGDILDGDVDEVIIVDDRLPAKLDAGSSQYRDDVVFSEANAMRSFHAQLFAEFIRIAADSGRRIFKFGSIFYEFCGVRDKSVRNFSGHVFTMQTRAGYYSVSGAFVQAKNCRCVSKSVIKGFS